MSANRARLAPLGLAFLLVFLPGCAIPLAPGYHLRSETMATRYRPSAPTALRIQVESVVRNVGNRALGHMTVELPKLFPENGSVQVWVTGRPVIPVQKTVVGRTQVIVPFHPPLAQTESIRFRFEYEIRPPAREFVLEPGDWFATFLRPKHLFAKGRSRAKKMEVRIFLPAGYSAVLGGRRRGVRHGKPGGETEYRFQVRERDFSPFLAIGNYSKRKVRAGGRDVDFWTLQPLGAGCANTIAVHLATTADRYRAVFGRLFKHRQAIPVIEWPTGEGSQVLHFVEGFGSVPGGIVFSVSQEALCGQPEQYFALADRALARTWFGWAVAPETETRAVLGSGAPRYAAFVAGASRSGSEARKQQVRDWIADYDRLRSGTVPPAPIRLGEHPLPAQRKMAGIQSALFLIALEDRYGAEAVRRALAHLVGSLRGSTAGLDDVRSALEQETQQNLFDFFGQWLGHAGIPAGFRERYSVRRSQTADEKSSR